MEGWQQTNNFVSEHFGCHVASAGYTDSVHSTTYVPDTGTTTKSSISTEAAGKSDLTEPGTQFRTIHCCSTVPCIIRNTAFRRKLAESCTGCILTVFLRQRYGKSFTFPPVHCLRWLIIQIFCMCSEKLWRNLAPVICVRL